MLVLVSVHMAGRFAPALRASSRLLELLLLSNTSTLLPSLSRPSIHTNTSTALPPLSSAFDMDHVILHMLLDMGCGVNSSPSPSSSSSPPSSCWCSAITTPTGPTPPVGGQDSFFATLPLFKRVVLACVRSVRLLRLCPMCPKCPGHGTRI